MQEIGYLLQKSGVELASGARCPSPGVQRVKAERIDSSLHPRSWSFNRNPENLARQFLLLLDGSAEAEIGAERLAITAPAVLWLGKPEPGRLRGDAGATGFRGSATSAMLEAAVGDQAESINLRLLTDRDFVLSLVGAEGPAGTIERCFQAALNELQRPHPTTPLMLSALLRIMLTAMLRISGGPAGEVAGTAGKTGLLPRFRQLVELNFRHHWPVSRYASELGVSGDRLHAICTTGIGKSPKKLISERLAHEAALRLERSTLTIQQLGHSLGFNDPAHFSNFFRRMTGKTPGNYRRMATGPDASERPAAAQGFADWP